MSSETLTPELISLIIYYLSLDDQGCSPESGPIFQYAAVSREWQTQVERRTFSTLHLTPARLGDFERTMKSRSRRGNVQEIKFHTVLESYGVEVWGEYETEEDQRRNNEVFTRTFLAFFGILSSWSDEEVAHQGITLTVRSHSPSDLRHIEPSLRKARRLQIKMGRRDG